MKVRERTERCKSTHSNPDTGIRDTDVLGALNSWGHQDFSVRAEVIEGGMLILYEVFEEFSGRRETTIKYEICDSGKCDFSFIYITVEQ